MIDHVTISVTDLARSKAFYQQAFAPLGYDVAFGKDEVFWAFRLSDGLFEIQQATTPGPLTSMHIAFRVAGMDQVDAFHHAAIAAGAQDNGQPGPRDYEPGYYAAFVLDPDGNNIEAMLIA